MVSHANLVVFAFFKQPPFLSLKGLVPLLMVCSLDGIALLFISLALPHGLKCIIIDDIWTTGECGLSKKYMTLQCVGIERAT